MSGNNDEFFGGAPSLSWSRQRADGEYEDIPELQGVPRGGVITDIQGSVQMTEMTTNKPLFWDEQKTRPKMMYVFTLRCDGSTGVARDERDGNPADDGSRRVYVRGKDMKDAIAAAFRGHGERGLRVGSELYLAWTGYRPSKGGGKRAKTYAAKYIPRQAPEAEWSDAVGENAPAEQQQPVNPFGGQQFTGPQPTAQSAPAGPPAPQWGNGPNQGQPVTTAAPGQPQQWGQAPGAPAQGPPPANPFGSGAMPTAPAAPPQQATNPFGS